VIRRLLALLLLVAPASAETLPALFDVTGVASDDVLNIRAYPSAGASQIGQLAHDTRGVEVVALNRDATWGQVNTWEWAGWVNMRYLTRQPGPDWTALASPLKCHGTEPFWSLAYDPSGPRLTLEQMDSPAPLHLHPEGRIPTQGRPGQIGIRLAGPAQEGFATLTAQDCTDGMSDRRFGLAVALFLSPAPDGAAQSLGLSGCCSLER
jgi:uncharacterized membrane protein